MIGCQLGGYPMLVTNGQEFIAHHLAKSGESPYAYDIKLTTSKDGGKTWIEAGVLHDDGKQAEHGFVTLLPYNENFFVVWLDGRNTVMEGMENMAGHHGSHHGAMSLRAAILDSQGKKINEWELDNKTCDCCQTSAAITDNGYVVVYRDRSDEIRDISIQIDRWKNGRHRKQLTMTTGRRAALNGASRS